MKAILFARAFYAEYRVGGHGSQGGACRAGALPEDARSRSLAFDATSVVRLGYLLRKEDLGDDQMNLKLVASSDNRALAIRDHLLPLVRASGRLEIQHGLVRLVVLRQAPLLIHHWTPFNDLQPGEASSPGYRHAVERQHAAPDLPYGLGVWHGVKVLTVLWENDGRFEVVSFVRGAWEDLALAL